MSVNPVLRMLPSVAGVSNSNFIRTSSKEAKPTALEKQAFPKSSKAQYHGTGLGAPSENA